jgi:hypothetical protein
LHALATENIDRSRPARTRIPGDDVHCNICIRYKMCNHAMPNPPIGSASAALSQRRLGDGGAALESGPYGVPAPLRLLLFSLPPSRFVCTTSPVLQQQQHPESRAGTQIPRQDLINPPSFVIDRSPSHTYQAQQNVATLLGFVCRTTFVCVFYHVPKQILLELFVNDS